MSLAWEDVPGWFDWDGIYKRAVMLARDGAHFVEVGGYCGKSSIYLARLVRASGKRIKIDVVDCYGDPAFGATPNTFRHFVEELRVADLINLRVMTDLEAAATYPDGSLDFVWLDADHTYEGTKAAILAYLPKLRRGGVLGGHDMTTKYPGVLQAVGELLPAARTIGGSFLADIA